MFELKMKIENITGGFNLTSNGLVVCVDEFLVEYDLDAFEKLKESEVRNNSVKISLVDNSIIGLSNNEITFFDSDLNIFDSISFDSGIGDFHTSPDGKVVVGVDYDYTLFLPISGVYDLVKKELLWEGSKGDSLKLFNDQVFGISKTRLCNLNPVDGAIKWSFYFEEEQTIPTVYYGSESIVLIGFEKMNILSLIEGKSGKVLWSIDSYSKGVRVDPERNLIYQFLIGYNKYSLSTGELLDKNVNREYFSKIEIESQRSNYTFSKDYIFTTDWRKGVLGAFNINKKIFDWVYRLDSGNFPANKRLIWKDPYLLIEDSMNNLYVFKKQLP